MLGVVFFGGTTFFTVLAACISRVENNLLGDLAGYKFCNKSNSATQNAQNTTKSKNYEEAQKYFQLIAVFAAK